VTWLAAAAGLRAGHWTLKRGPRAHNARSRGHKCVCEVGLTAAANPAGLAPVVSNNKQRVVPGELPGPNVLAVFVRGNFGEFIGASPKSPEVRQDHPTSSD